MDSYIDHHETQVYGDRFSGTLRRMFGADAPREEFTFVLWCAERLDEATKQMRDAMSDRRNATSQAAAAAQEKLPVCRAGRAELKAFLLHLVAKKADQAEAWSGDVSLFFPVGLSGVGAGARSLRDATRTAMRALASDTTVPERATWLRRLTTHATRLHAVVERVDGTGHAQNTAFSEQSLEKRNWLRAYRGVAMVLQGVLLLLGREHEYVGAVPHLAAPGTRRPADGPSNVGDVPTGGTTAAA